MTVIYCLPYSSQWGAASALPFWSRLFSSFSFYAGTSGVARSGRFDRLLKSRVVCDHIRLFPPSCFAQIKSHHSSIARTASCLNHDASHLQLLCSCGDISLSFSCFAVGLSALSCHRPSSWRRMIWDWICRWLMRLIRVAGPSWLKSGTELWLGYLKHCCELNLLDPCLRAQA